MSLIIWHNPRCSKSRQALQLLTDAGHQPVVRQYLKDAPGEHELAAVVSVLRLNPRDIMRKGEAVYKQLGLSDAGLSDAELIAVMSQHPILIERPIVLADGKAVIGRPPEAVLTIL